MALTYYAFTLPVRPYPGEDTEYYLDVIEACVKQAIEEETFAFDEAYGIPEEEPKLAIASAEYGYNVGLGEVMFLVNGKFDLEFGQAIPGITSKELQRAKRFGDRARSKDGKMRLTRSMATKILRYHSSGNLPSFLRNAWIVMIQADKVPAELEKLIPLAEKVNITAEDIRGSLLA